MSWTVGVDDSGQVVKGLNHSLLVALVNGIQKPTAPSVLDRFKHVPVANDMP